MTEPVVSLQWIARRLREFKSQCCKVFGSNPTIGTAELRLSAYNQFRHTNDVSSNNSKRR